ncbi:MAG: type IV secretion system protein [Phenylobacterium sp.]|uniref:type IV secretion system protein n=1 Tax=Phenylobacterium sp. TaxID=1871053 RepID=UPI0027328C21|nr:type IV secretion system protein [Phenylobacterium sp.]MDP3749297.1 type IV secretion system protein [Phenylobacterium sp.]
MATQVQIFEPAYAYVDGRLTDFLDTRLGDVMSEVSGPLRAAFVLYVVLYGFAILRGAVAEPIMDFAIRAMKLVFINAIATTPAYGSFVTDPLFNDLPNTLARALSGGDASTVGEAFDELINYGAYLADEIDREGSLIRPGMWVLALVVFVVAALTAALGFGVVLVAKIALALLVAIGPIFVACALFEASRRFFFGWLSQAVSYLVLFAIILTLVQLVLDLIRSQWASIEAQDPFAAGLVFVALCVLAGFFFLSAPSIAAGVAGGPARASPISGVWRGQSAAAGLLRRRLLRPGPVVPPNRRGEAVDETRPPGRHLWPARRLCHGFPEARRL